MIAIQYDAVKEKVLVSGKPKLTTILTEKNTDLGLVFHVKFGWKVQRADAGIADYDVISRCFVVDWSGEVVWKFGSRGSITPRPFKGGMQELHEFGQSVLAADLSDDLIVSHFGEFFDEYPEYLIQRIDDDLSSRTHEHFHKTAG